MYARTMNPDNAETQPLEGEVFDEALAADALDDFEDETPVTWQILSCNWKSSMALRAYYEHAVFAREM